MASTTRTTYARSDLYAYRYLVWQLVRQSIIGSYKKSFIGLAWLFLLPLFAVVVWIFLQNSGVLSSGDTGNIPYPVYVLLSTSIWGLFIEMYRSVSQVMVQNGRLLIMKDFPATILVISKIIEQIILFVVPLFINIIVFLFFGIEFKAIAFFFLPSLLPIILLGVGLGMVIAVLRVVAVDMSTIIDECMKLLMFATPIIYTTSATRGWISELINANPLTYLIGFPREILTNGTLYEPRMYFLTTIIVLLFFILALLFFQKVSKRILERLTIV